MQSRFRHRKALRAIPCCRGKKRQYKTRNKTEIPAAKHKMTVENLVTITIIPFSSSTRTMLLFCHLLCMRFFVNGLESM